MKIVVEGNIIDLSLIYRIGPIVGNAAWGPHTSDAIINKKLYHSAYSFEIFFVNQNLLKLSLDINKIDTVGILFTKEENYTEYQKCLNIVFIKVEKLRSVVSEKWNNNKPLLDYIDFSQF